MPTLAEDEVLGMEPLNAADRCDRCGAQAYLRVVVPGDCESHLLFCAHHAHEHEQALRDKGCAVTRDERTKLTPT